jgi:hypothetical protein
MWHLNVCGVQITSVILEHAGYDTIRFLNYRPTFRIRQTEPTWDLTIYGGYRRYVGYTIPKLKQIVCGMVLYTARDGR